MINPVSSQSAVQALYSQVAKSPATPVPAKTSQAEDSVQISAQAKAALAAGDADHDGDSH